MMTTKKLTPISNNNIDLQFYTANSENDMSQNLR